jgi:indolepyruvate ferredoxin oxidoreductase
MSAANPLSITLEDKYTHTSGRVFLTGIQALVRLPMLQRLRDLAAGLNTAGFVSGYRGSPAGRPRPGLWKAKQHLAKPPHRFQPGLNEDLAATAVWGTSRSTCSPARSTMASSRCGTARARASTAAATSSATPTPPAPRQHGGVLVIAGDDHAAKSSTLPHQTEHVFKAVMMPVLYPANVQEYLDSACTAGRCRRYSGCWVALQGAGRHGGNLGLGRRRPARVQIVLPDRFPAAADGLNIRWPDPPLVQEARLLNHKLYAALAYCRANRLNRVVIDSPRPAPRHHHRRQVLPRRAPGARRPRHRRPATPPRSASACTRSAWSGRWSRGVRRFAEGLEEILVVEEKRQLLEYQLKEELYNWREDVRPRVIGKFDEKGEWALPQGDWLLPAAGELTPAMIARVIAERIGRFFTSPRIAARLASSKPRKARQMRRSCIQERTPYFCSGCPHNTSTKVPEGSRALAGIGCHYMATWMDRSTATFTQMGGEGRALGRPGAVHRHESTSSPTSATAPTSTPACSPSRQAVAAKVQHHLQDPLQRRGGDDRRPAGRRHAERRRSIARQLRPKA